ncbi:hypothetical protein CC78DRAFT_582149 [Lojkania enalia]|uniref:Transmembrane protein n=1 Tax=Lojkania enalia TaxID=147567 RepID=A0A9P4K4L8_9PLEO|nr:hypothetical protein CC78DRAFT_582149 [Didymosphaeria enalia]
MEELVLPTTASPPDPLGIANVISLYGPGAWAGWILVNVTGCFVVFCRPQSRRIHGVLVSILMMNWAAIDLLHQVQILDTSPRQDSNEQPEQKINTGPIAAAIILTYWGLCAHVFQLFLCVSKEASEAQRWRISLRTGILLGGAIIPSLALTSLLHILDPFFGSDTNSVRSLIDEDIPAFYYEGIDADKHWVYLQHAAMLGLWCGVFVALFSLLLAMQVWCPKSFLRSINRVFGKDASSCLFNCAVVAVPMAAIPFAFFSGARFFLEFFLVVAFLYPMALWLIPLRLCGYVFFAFSSGFEGVESSCYLMPCSPQRIDRWDQTLALMAGMVLFGVDLGPEILRIVRRWIKFSRGRYLDLMSFYTLL